MVWCYCNVVVRFCECGMMLEVEGLFEDMCLDKDLFFFDVFIFRFMVNGYVCVGRVDDVIKILNKLVILKLCKVFIYED